MREADHCGVRCRRSGLWGSLLVVLAISACSDAPPPEPPLRPVRTQLIEASAASVAGSYPATLQARRESAHGFQVSGRVVERAVQLGETVKRGQLLARIDAQDYRLNQQAARAQLAAAEVELQQTRADLGRFEELHRQGFISAADIEHRRTASRAAQARYEQARANYDGSVNQADYTRLVASLDGVVTRVDAEVGQVLAAGQPVLFIAQSSQLDAVFQVPEQQAVLLKPGDPIQVKAWAAEQRWPARIRERSASADPLTRTFLVKAGLDAPADEDLRPGMSATVETAGPGSEGVMLPLSALVQADGKASVWVLDEQSMTVRPQPVTVVSVGDQQVQVTGLGTPLEIVTAGVHQLQSGQTVKRLGDPTPPANGDQRVLDTRSLGMTGAQP